MNKTVRKFQIIIFVVIIVELVLLSIFSTLYLTNSFGMMDDIDPMYICIGALALVVIDLGLVWFIVYRLGRIRQATDLVAAQVIGSDVQEAYNFAMVGLIVTDQEDNILWTNDLFSERHLDIIDLNVLDWQPELRVLKENNSRNNSTTITINDRFYQVKLLDEAGLWIFKDVTDYENVSSEYRDNSTVIGILTIDNYQDLVKGEEDLNDTISNVKAAIFKYAHDQDVFLRRYKDDTYYFICNYKALVQIQKEGFSIIDTVHTLGHTGAIRPTISMGIAYDFPDMIKLNDLANEALQIAMSRGGDQVVIYPYGKEMEFVGGKSEAQEQRNRVKIRVLADSLFNVIKSSNKVYIVGHKDLDLDALGACLGIKAICNRLDKYARAVIDLKLVEQKTRSAITSCFNKEQLNDIMVSSKEAIEGITPDTLVVVVDVHTQALCLSSELIEKANKIVVIDHHRRGEEIIENLVFNELDSSASSTCELIAELIKYATINPKVDLPSMYATIMLSGIFLDTRNFKAKKTGMRTFEACTILKDYGADNAQADDFLKDDYEEYQMISHLLLNLKTPSAGIVYAVGEESMMYDNATLAKAADTGLEMKGNHAVFMIGKTSNTGVRISCRSDSTFNVQLVAERLGGGGHFTSSACQFEHVSLSEATERLLATLEALKDEIKVTAKRNRDYREEEE